MKKRKLLVLGGKPVCSYEIIEYAKSKSVYTIVTDYLPVNKSRAKQIADEVWNISTDNVDGLEKLCIENKVDAVFAGVHEFNLEKAMELCGRLRIPFYSTKEQWDFGTDKGKFKKMCNEYGLPVPKDYDYTKTNDENISYPIIVKPVDGSSGRGISICHNKDDLDTAYQIAMNHSLKKQVIVEELIEGEEIVAFYTIKDSDIRLSVLTDYYYNYEQEVTMPLPQAYIYPSKHINKYVTEVNDSAISLIKGLGIKQGTFFLQAFINDKGFFFFEPGFRPGGSSVYKYTKHLNNISYLEMLVDYALTGNMDSHDLNSENPYFSKPCCTLSLVSKGGEVGEIKGLEEVISSREILDYEKRYDVGDIIAKKSALGQIHLRFFIVANDFNNLVEVINKIQNTIEVLDVEGNNMLITKFNTKRLKGYKWENCL